MSDLIEKVNLALHNKLFAMNGYTKLPGAMEKTEEVCEVVVKAVAEWLEKSGSMQAAIVGNILLEQLEGSE